MHSDSFDTDFLSTAYQMAFTAKHIGSGKDIDPDLNFIGQNCKDSLYYAEHQFTELINKKSIDDSNFSIFHINARSLPNKIDALIDLLRSLKLNFSIIAITETWSND